MSELSGTVAPGSADPGSETAPTRRRGGRSVRRSATLTAGLVLVGIVVLMALVSLVWLPYPLDDTPARAASTCSAPTSSGATC